MRIAVGVLSLAIAAGLTWQAARLIEAACLGPTTWPRVTGLVIGARPVTMLVQ